MSVKGGVIRALTGLRGLAACWVMVFHAWSMIGAPQAEAGSYRWHDWLQTCYFGVDLFSVRSGFLLARPFLRARLHQGPSPSW